jgi:hypothetical protein
VVRVPGYRSWGPGFESRRYQIFWEVVGLERGPLSLVRTTEELLEWKVAAPGLENRDYGRGDPLRWPRDTLYRLKLALTSPAGCGRSVGIIRSRTKTTEILDFFYLKYKCRLSQNNALARNLFGAVRRIWALMADILNISSTSRVPLSLVIVFFWGKGRAVGA